jgi:PTH2 family peptidyl-tRNA hydrolase
MNFQTKLFLHGLSKNVSLNVKCIQLQLDSSTSSEEDFREASGDDFFDESDFYKMVFVVNTSLKMGIGKLAAQVAHASLGLYRTMVENQQRFGEMLLQWEQFG